MARIKLPDELKKAISLMPDREKDKLLFRLIAKDPMLAEQLVFKLLEGGESTEDRRTDVRQLIEKHYEGYAPFFHSPGYLLLEMRHLSGRISEHVRTTRDKYGEVELNLLLLIRPLEMFGKKISQATPRRSQTLNQYVVNRTIKLLSLLEKLHEDHRLDFQESLEKLARFIRQQPAMMDVAVDLGLELEELGGN